MSVRCKQCFGEDKTVVSEIGLVREKALARFLQLHHEGDLPVMCEDHHGRYNVCFNMAHRPILAKAKRNAERAGWLKSLTGLFAK